MIMRKIFDGVFDKEVHVNFLKFGKGTYKGKFLIDGKKQAKNWGIKTGSDDANSLVKRCLKKVGLQVMIKGIIISTLDLRNEVNFEIKKVSNFRGIRKHIIDTEINANDMIDLMNKLPKAFFALSFKGEDFVLKIKAKAPSSKKNVDEGSDGYKADFCTLKTTDKSLVDELFFNVKDFNNVKINHTIKITNIVYPANIGELKPEEIRELAKRKGVVIRTVDVDGNIKNSETNFIV